MNRGQSKTDPEKSGHSSSVRLKGCTRSGGLRWGVVRDVGMSADWHALSTPVWHGSTGSNGWVPDLIDVVSLSGNPPLPPAINLRACRALPVSAGSRRSARPLEHRIDLPAVQAFMAHRPGTVSYG